MIDYKTEKAEILVKAMKDDQDLAHPLAIHNLIDCMELLHTSTTLYYNKISGRWIFSSLHEDEWAHNITDITSGANFCFIDAYPEIVIIKGLLYLDKKGLLCITR